jgi:tryptophanyl-tRNA synthetase
MSVVLSGIQPSGSLHIGHLVGALENFASLQSGNTVFYMIADWHALTSKYNQVEIIQPSVYELAATFLAVGINPNSSSIFVQSAVKEHSELQLLLSMTTPLSWLERVPTYKEKQANSNADLNSFGFLGYPLLQAADILMYQADQVPVGEDQLFHLELTREVARRFNHLFKIDFFKEPQAVMTSTAKVLGLDGRKMSKTYNNCIYLSDNDSVIKEKCTRQMISDPQRVKKADPGNPDQCLVFGYHKIFSSQDTQNEVHESCRAASIGCYDCKMKIAENLISKISPVRERAQASLNNLQFIDDVVREGNARARKVAQGTMEKVREIVKLPKY